MSLTLQDRDTVILDGYKYFDCYLEFTEIYSPPSAFTKGKWLSDLDSKEAHKATKEELVEVMLIVPGVGTSSSSPQPANNKIAAKKSGQFLSMLNLSEFILSIFI